MTAAAIFPRMRDWRALLLTLSGAWMVIGGLIAVEAVGLRINATASMPRGLWLVRPPTAALKHGDVATLCLPDSDTVRLAASRGYITGGSCPNGYEPLVKPIAAVAGALVTVSPAGIAVDGTPVPGTAQLAKDSAGRPLTPFPAGSYRVSPGEVWILSSYDPRSFDSRYFGPVPIASVQGLAWPVWVFR